MSVDNTQRHMIQDALYRNIETGEVFVFAGLKQRTVVFKDEATGEHFEVIHSEFFDLYEDTGIHHHDRACCTLHGTHSVPHMGCLLR